MRWNPDISPDGIRQELTEAPDYDRHRIIRRNQPLIDAALVRIPALQRPLRLAFRRAVEALESRTVAVDEQPGLKHAFRLKEVGALFGFYGCLGFELGVGILISMQVLAMGVLPAVLFGTAITAFVALQAKAVAANAVDFERLARWRKWLVGTGAVAFAASLAMLGLFAAARNGILPAWVISATTPLLPIILGVGSTAFAALANVYAYPRQLYEEIERLEAIRVGLHAVRLELDAETSGAIDGRKGSDAKSAVRVGRRRQPNGRAAALMALAVVTLLHGAAGPTASIAAVGERRLYLMPDVTSTGEQSDEEARIRRLLGASIEQLCEALGGIDEVVLLPWSDGESLWRAGELFTIPKPQQVEHLGEARIDFFRPAFDREEELAREQALLARRPVYQRIARSLLASPARPASRSCVSEALNRAASLPTGTFAVIPTDLADFRCPAEPRPGTKGAAPVVCVVVVPRRERDQGTRTRERRETFASRYPDLLFVDSFDLTGPSSLMELAEQMRRHASRGER